MVGKTASQTKADQARMAAMSGIDCIPCMIDGWDDVPATVQHVTEVGRRLEDEHQHTYRSCAWHHLGEPPPQANGSPSAAAKMYGPSFKHNPREFAEHYGSERQLVQIQTALVRMQDRENQRGRYLTSAKIGRLAIALHAELVLGKSPDPEAMRVI